jgi:osmotically inducible lipoprotein OsmB
MCSFIVLAFLASLTACGTLSERERNTAIGAAVGAAATESALGTAAGAAAGGIIGHELSKDKD